MGFGSADRARSRDMRLQGASLGDLKNSKTVWRLLGFVLKHNKVGFLVVTVCIVVSSLATLASTLFTRTLIDDYITPMTAAAGAPDYAPLAVAIFKLMAVLLVGVAASYAQSLIMIHVGQGTMHKLRDSLFSHMETLPLSYFDGHSHGDTMSVYTNDVDTLRQVISSSLPRLFQSVVTIVATFVSMVALSLPLTLVSILMAVVMYRVTTKLGKLSKKYFAARQENLGKVNGFIEEMVSGQKAVKAYCHEEIAAREFASLNEELRSSVYNANKIANIVMPINSNIGNFGYVLLAIIGAIIAIGGFGGWYFCGLNGSVLTLGTLVSFLTLHKNFVRPVSQISSEINSLVMASAGTDRVYALLDEESEIDEGTVTLEKSGKGNWLWKTEEGESKPLEGLISLKDVDFAYVPDKQVLYDISLTAWPGQKIAFVGGTGAGKTTITNLMGRFYEISDGVITYDGFPVTDIKKNSLRRSLGTVLQETRLFSGTVMENIRYGRLEATDEECIAAAKLACADQFIRRLPHGYATVISGEGGNLSQGEMQLLSIARAAVADPPVLILDEATSSIDTRTEKLIQKGMDSLMAGRTTFVIAHRLSTVRNADYIMVLDHGHIIERGKHNELLAQKGKYWELFTGNQITA